MQEMLGQPAHARRGQEEDPDGDHKGEPQGQVKSRSFELFIFAALQVGRVGQRPHAQPERVPQHDQTAQEGNFGNP